MLLFLLHLLHPTWPLECTNFLCFLTELVTNVYLWTCWVIWHLCSFLSPLLGCELIEDGDYNLIGFDIPGTEKYAWQIDAQYMLLNDSWIHCIIVTCLFSIYCKSKGVIQILFIFVSVIVWLLNKYLVIYINTLKQREKFLLILFSLNNFKCWYFQIHF